jgi:hypothetical protein
VYFLKLKLASCAPIPGLPETGLFYERAIRPSPACGRPLRAGFLAPPHPNRTTPMTTPTRYPGGRPVTRALIAALDESAPGADASSLRRIVDTLIGKAIGGDLSAIREIFDRIDGKTPTAAAGAAPEDPQKVVFQWKSDQ